MLNMTNKENDNSGVAGKLNANEWNKLINVLNRVITSTGDVMGDDSDEQFLKAIDIFTKRSVYSDNGNVNQISLSRPGGIIVNDNYIDGSELRFISKYSNTGSTTIHVDNLADLTLKLNGVDLVADDILGGYLYSGVIDTSAGVVNMVKVASGSSTTLDGNTVEDLTSLIVDTISNGAGSAYDTLKEIQTELENNDDDISTIMTALNTKAGKNGSTSNLFSVKNATDTGHAVAYGQANGRYAYKAGTATQVFSVESATANDHAVSRIFGDGRYALKAGSTSNLFSVKNATATGHAVAFGQANSRYAYKAGTATQVFSVESASADDHAVSRIFGDGRYALKAGSTSNLFSVKNATAVGHAVAYGQANSRYAYKAGATTQVFSVESASADDHAVSRIFGDGRYALKIYSGTKAAYGLTDSAYSVIGTMVFAVSYTTGITAGETTAASNLSVCGIKFTNNTDSELQTGEDLDAGTWMCLGYAKYDGTATLWQRVA